MPGPTLFERVLRAPLWAHAAALLVVLLAFVPLLADGEIWHADEGALLAQVDQLDRTGEWVQPNPDPALDPEHEALPLELAFRGTDGTWAPYHKHAPYVALAWGAQEAFGSRGPWLLSIAGTVLAAAAAALLARRVRPSLAVVALWVTGLATPLFFDSYLAIAHTVGAALAGWIAVATLRCLDAGGSHGRRALAGGSAVAGAVLLGMIRSEGVLLAIALGLAVMAVTVVQRLGRVGIAAGLGLIGAALIAYKLEPLLTEAVWGEGLSTLRFGTGDEGGLIQGRLDAFSVTMLYPSYDRTGLQVLPVVGVILLWGAAVLVRRDPSVQPIIRVLLIAVTVFYVVRLDGVGPIPGLLVAMPVLVGFVGLDRDAWRRREVAVLTVAFVLFVAAVLATQYARGGSGEWGGRYFAIGLPLAVPPALEGLRSLGTVLDAATRRVGLACLVVASVALLAVGVDAMESGQDGGASIAAAVTAARDEAGNDGPASVLTTDAAVGRFTWPEALEGRWYTVDDASLDRYSERLAGREQPVVFFTTEPDRDIPILDRRWVVEPYEGDAVFVLTPR